MSIGAVQVNNSIENSGKENYNTKRASGRRYNASSKKYLSNFSGYYTKQSPHKKSTSRKRKSDHSKKKFEIETKNHCKELKNFINEVKSLSPRYMNYKSNSKCSRQSSKVGNSSIRKIADNSSMATMKYKNLFIMSPNSKSNKMMKKKKEAHKKKHGHSSKVMRSGSMSSMFHNNSITDSGSKKSMKRQKTSGALKKLPYSISQKMLGSTLKASSPTTEMFNSITNSQKYLKKNVEMISPTTYSKFRNTFLSMYDYNSPTTASGSTTSGPGNISTALKKMLTNKKQCSVDRESQIKQDASYINNLINSKINETNTVTINSSNGKPLMINVGPDAKGLVEYSDYIRQASKTPVHTDAH